MCNTRGSVIRLISEYLKSKIPVVEGDNFEVMEIKE